MSSVDVKEPATLPVPSRRRLAALLAGVVGDGSVSMARYASEISTALSRMDQQCWQFNLVQPVQKRWASRIWNHSQARRLESATARYVSYPAAIHRQPADLFHVLDHGYGHLVRALEPERALVTCHDLIPLLSAHGRIPIRVPAGVVKTFTFRINEMARAGRILTISEATRSSLLEFTDIPASRITVIPYGVNSIFRPAEPGEIEAARTAFEIPAGVVVVLQVATRGRYKNTPGVLKAFAALRARLGPKVMLVRLGAPLYENEADLADQLGVSPNLRYAGMVNDDRILAQWYRAAAVLAFPSFWEGFGWPPLEAMACGTPVVASTIPAIKEVVADAADLVDPGDDDAIARALERVISDPAHAGELRAKGLARARMLTWAESARRTLATYDEVYRGIGQVARVR